MYHIPSPHVTSRHEQYAIAKAKAEQEADSMYAYNAYWHAKAREVQTREKAERERADRQRAELVSCLMQPGALDEVVAARARFGVSITGVAADRPIPTKFCWAPKGSHEISAGTADGGVWSGTVIVDQLGAIAVQLKFLQLKVQGCRSFIDFFHRDAEAAAWILGFSWDPEIGIMVEVEWTSAGEIAVRDGLFVSFSPAFLIDNETGRIAGIPTLAAAGGLVNTPAFGAAMPALLSAGGRSAAANLVRRAMLGVGHSEQAADSVGRLIASGADAAAVATYLRSFSG
jgi:hypothetical protein